ncbi:MAG: transcription antitermination factor NusB [Bacillota bacterium]
MTKKITRHQAREITVQFLYQIDINEDSLRDNLDNLAHEHPELNLEDSFLIDMITGAYQKIDEIDEFLDNNIENWKVDRMAKVDRNVIRLALYEALYEADIPVAVSINEAVELAKSFSNQESAKFVNGVLGKAIDELELEKDE